MLGVGKGKMFVGGIEKFGGRVWVGEGMRNLVEIGFEWDNKGVV